MHQPTPWRRLILAAPLAFVLDVAIFFGLAVAGATDLTTNLFTFSVSTVLGYGLLARRLLAPDSGAGSPPLYILCGRFLIIFVLALFFRGILFSHLTETSHWPPLVAIVAAAVSGHLVQLLGVCTVVFASGSWIAPSPSHWRKLAILVVTYITLLKFAAMGPINLIPEEAYYWNYAQNLDLSYLDHPPMVAWLIWISTSLFGRSEFAVRFPAVICWAVAAAFMFRLTARIFDRDAAFRSLVLMAVLPFYFGFGFFMTPDTPLFAAWAGCLYYLYHALIRQKRNAWWGASICMGLGLLSKYTILLLGLSTAGYLLADQRSRQWWTRAEPYFATIISVIIFLPVLIWNARQGWASFVFQGPRRWSDEFDFSLPFFLGSILLALTPVGVAAAAWALLPRRAAITAVEDRRQWLFGALFTLLPLSVFLFFSLFHQPKINWAAPLWLAILPWIAGNMAIDTNNAGRLFSLLQRLWVPTVAALLLTTAVGFYFIYLGLPGTGRFSEGRLLGPWQLVGTKIDAIQRKVEAETGTRPLVIGVERYMITSELAFYDQVHGDRFKNAGGPHLFGGQALMWEFWFPSKDQIGKNMILVDLQSSRLRGYDFARFFERVSDVSMEPLVIDGRNVGRFYWRVGYGYRNPPPAINPAY